MNSSNILMFGILIFLMTVISVQSIKCYQCLSCNDPFNEKDSDVTIETCAGSCVKGKYEGAVARACSDYSGGDQCAKVGEAHSCSCTSDLCNSASGVRRLIFASLSLSSCFYGCFP
ncbi:uncharacterized protein LOC132745847 [Ruditapes philippinarum]|uniref:uncharacterized protein LOC132745847 n=1 Tax=Ruditapes philippinarum TaxID=129788 RepID=UPI00295B3010|nr:uncharacterized protein LOC132745847 [Ruditapes philippinarum]